jgi:hypothetical protein
VLVRSVLVCSWRRLRPFLVANPLVAAVALLALPGLPILALVAGGRVAPSLSKALLEQSGVIEAFVAAIVFSGAFAGAIIVAVAPGPDAFGPQLSVAPIRRMRFLWAGAGFPLTLAALAVSGLLALAALPVAARLPAGRAFAIELLFAVLCACALGALTIESALAAARVRPAAVFSLCLIAAFWIVAASISGSRVLGPFAAITGSLKAGRGDLALRSAALAVLTLAAFLVWLYLSATRVPARVRAEPRIVLLRMPRSPFRAGAVVAVKRLSRRTELRRQITAIIFLCVLIGPALLVLVPAVSDLVVLGMVSFTAVSGVALIALAAVGIDEEGQWLWTVAPSGARSRSAGNAFGAIVLALFTCLFAIAPSFAIARPSFSLLIDFIGFSCFVLGIAVVSGAIVPWRSDRVVEQIASYTACIVLVGALWYLVGKVAAPLAARGAPDPLIFATLGLTTVAIGVGLSAIRVRGERS